MEVDATELNRTAREFFKAVQDFADAAGIDVEDFITGIDIDLESLIDNALSQRRA